MLVVLLICGPNPDRLISFDFCRQGARARSWSYVVVRRGDRRQEQGHRSGKHALPQRRTLADEACEVDDFAAATDRGSSAYGHG